MKNYKFTIGFSAKDCTGCSLCSSVCPGKKGNKAVTMKDKKSFDEKEAEELKEGIKLLNDEYYGNRIFSNDCQSPIY